MSLLDSDDIRELFGDVLDDVYGDGRLIRVIKVRGPGGVQLNQYQQPKPIKVQVDRCDEAMRQQAGYTDTDVKLLVLQAGIGGPMLTADDVIEARGQRWSIYGCGEDPAQSYWRGRGVRQATADPLMGWVLEFDNWDDGGEWRVSAPWEPVAAPYTMQPISDWVAADAAQKAILGAILSGSGDIASMSWQKAMDQLNAIGAVHDVEAIAVGDTGAEARAKINAIIEALSNGA